jgi:hypothetical protein
MQGLLSGVPADPILSQGAFAAALLGFAPPPPPPPPPPEAAFAAAGSPPELLQMVITHIKVHDLAPHQLEPGVSSLVRQWLGPAVLDVLAYVRPGCTLLSVHALCCAADAAAGRVGAGGAAALAAALGAPGAPLARSRFDVHDAAEAAVVVPQPLPPLRPRALLVGAPGRLTSVAPAGADGTLRAYAGGALLALAPADAAQRAGRPVSLPLPPHGCAPCADSATLRHHVC